MASGSEDLEIVTTTMSLSQSHPRERRKGAFEDVLVDEEMFHNFERWLKPHEDIINMLHFYREVYEWKLNRDDGQLNDDDDWREVATGIITGYLLSHSERPFGIMIEDGSEIHLEHDMFDGLAENILETLRVKFVVFQSELNIMVSPGIKQGSLALDTSPEPTVMVTSNRRKKAPIDDFTLKKPELAFSKLLKTEEFMEEYKVFLQESFPSQTAPLLYLEFFARAEAFEHAYSTSAMTSEQPPEDGSPPLDPAMKRQMCCIEAVKLFEHFFKEPKVELTAISPFVQKSLSNLLQPPSEPPSIDVNGYMFVPAQIQATKYLYNETYRVYKKNRKGRRPEEQEEAPPPPHVIQREMFNLYPEGSEAQIFWDSLADPIWVPKFRAYMEREIATENLNCWQDIQAFRKKYHQEDGSKICTPELVEDATVIFERYVKKGCKELVNINSRMSTTLHKKFQGENFPEEINQNIFLDVQREVFTIMTGNHYRPFTAAEQQAAAELAAAELAAAEAKKAKRRKKKPSHPVPQTKTPRASPVTPRVEESAPSASLTPAGSQGASPAIFDFGGDLGNITL